MARRVNRKKARRRQLMLLGGLAAVVLAVVLTAIFTSSGYRLSKLGYSGAAIDAVKLSGQQQKLLGAGYSQQFEQAVAAGQYLPENIDIYLSVTASGERIPEFINRLADKGYEKNEIIAICNRYDEAQIEAVVTANFVPGLAQLLETDYLKNENFARYIAYVLANPDMSFSEAVIAVNIGLDRPYYTEVQEVPDPHSALLLVNKYWKLPDGFEPKGLREISNRYVNSVQRMVPAAADAFEALCKEGLQYGVKLVGISAYRSNTRQAQLYNSYVQTSGQAYADTYSARPGHSEHETGLTIDVTDGNSLGDFEGTPGEVWMRDNAHRFGFIVRYPKGKEEITGFIYEPWHIRYVGAEIATELYETGLTLDEYWAMGKLQAAQTAE